MGTGQEGLLILYHMGDSQEGYLFRKTTYAEMLPPFAKF